MDITDGLDLIAPEAYAAAGPPHDTWTRLRKESPLHWCEPPGFENFWAVTKHAEICEISKQPNYYASRPGIVLMSDLQKQLREAQAFGELRVIIEMDPPEHRDYRKIASPHFTPRAVKALDEAVERSARELVDKLAGADGEGECDFAVDVATAHPLRILSTMLGVPEESEPDILRLTNQLFGADDPDLQREASSRQEASQQLGLELFRLFSGIIQDRRANPRDDMASVLANATIDGEPMGPMETLGYYLIVFTAGHDTTKNALAGGLNALLEHPDQLELLKKRPDLIDSAVEEFVRWAAPVNYMKRTAAEDSELRGQKIRAGDNLVLFYASANRDEDIFDDPFTFRIDRQPNRHLGFGIGEHFCLGSHLARKSQQALWRELAPRLEHIELTGEPEWIHSSFVVGLKRLPIRYRIAPGR
jgi:cytochrome P450